MAVEVFKTFRITARVRVYEQIIARANINESSQRRRTIAFCREALARAEMVRVLFRLRAVK